MASRPSSWRIPCSGRRLAAPRSSSIVTSSSDGAEGGVAAVVGPIGVYHPDFGDGGVPVLIAEVLLAEGDVCLVHGKAAIGDKNARPASSSSRKPSSTSDGLGLGGLHVQRLGQVERGDASLDGVHHVVLDGIDGGPRPERPRSYRPWRSARRGAHPADELHALAGGVGALVKLAGRNSTAKTAPSLAGSSS